MQITRVNPNYQTQKTQMKNNSQVNFRGRLGAKMLEKAGGLELKTVLSEVTGFFGLEAGKVKDVLESFVDRINIQEKSTKIMRQDIYSKDNRIKTLESQNKTLEEQAEINRAAITGRDNKIAELQQTIINKDKEIAELEAYRKMNGVKSFTELEIPTPNELLTTIQYAKDNEVDALQSALLFAMTGEGQEALVNQIERNNIILKGFTDGMKDIPKIKAALNGSHFGLGYDSEFIARCFFTDALKRSQEGSYLVSNSIRSQVEANMEAFLAPLRNPKYSYKPVKEITDSVLKYHQDLEINKLRMAKDFKMEFNEIVEVETGSLPEVYYLYTDRNGVKLRIKEQDLANGSFGFVEKLPVKK